MSLRSGTLNVVVVLPLPNGKNTAGELKVTLDVVLSVTVEVVFDITVVVGATQLISTLEPIEICVVSANPLKIALPDVQLELIV